MPRQSKNIFTISDDIIMIGHPDWEFVATASVKEEYLTEIQRVTWSQKGRYLYNESLGGYLHIYIMKKWYGDDVYEQMKNDGYVVDHMDNDGHNCCIDNLCFLMDNENKAKGLTVDQYSAEKTHIALTLCKDFYTELTQITIVFNYPAVAKISTLDKPAVIEMAFLLYDKEYPEVINDAKKILFDYYNYGIFEPQKLNWADYQIEGHYGVPISKEAYDKYISGGHGHTIFYMERKAPLLGWTVNEHRQLLRLL